jgi:hypothetical protein
MDDWPLTMYFFAVVGFNVGLLVAEREILHKERRANATVSVR